VSKYAAAGVKLDTAEEAKRRIAELVRSTRTPLARGQVAVRRHGPRAGWLQEAVLVMSTDGVGTKVLVAAAAGIHDTVGEDLVNHSVNDILVHGATPLAFLDYIATDISSRDRAQIVAGVARGCKAHDMTLAAERRRSCRSLPAGITTWRDRSSAWWKRTRRCMAIA